MLDWNSCQICYPLEIKLLLLLLLDPIVRIELDYSYELKAAKTALRFMSRDGVLYY